MQAVGQPVCDFCSDPEVAVVYPADDAVIQVVAAPEGVYLHESLGAWAACRPCHDLIEVGDRGALALRAAHRLAAQHGLLAAEVPAVTAHIRRVHDGFFVIRRTVCAYRFG